MQLEVRIKKKLRDFLLDMEFIVNDKCMGILGHSGSGKSMTLKCIAGIEKPDEGKIVLDGQVLYDSKEKIDLPPQKRKVGYLFQNYALFPTMTVEENILACIKGNNKQRYVTMKEEMKRFRLSGLEKCYPHELSGGQQQRVALARILSYKPSIILLDEPFASLDYDLKDELHLELMEMIHDYEGTIMMVSHDRDEIYKMTKELLILEKGKIKRFGQTRHVFVDPQHVDAAILTGCKNISRVEKINDYCLYATEWDIKLVTSNKIKDSITYVGIRAHSLVPSDNYNERNIMKMALIGISQLPFEIQFIMRNADEPKSHEVWWTLPLNDISKHMLSMVPKYLRFPREALMLLESD